jgi:hypothetical protein
MRCSSWTTARRPAGATSARARPCIGWMLLALAMVLPRSEASADTLGCGVTSVGVASEGELAKFTVTLGCGEEGDPVPLDTDLVAGLTLYGTALVEDYIAQGASADLPPGPGGAERILVNDDSVDRQDLEAQQLRISADTTEVTLTFTTPSEAIADKPYFLFALWNGAAKEACDQADTYARQGCRDFGYVIGWDLYEGLVLAYPGLTTVTTGESDVVAPYEVERWIVERFQ